ncbi:hypothetical protein ABZ897_26665 [Nonomuraea sp. NPDC046802]|uniref:hypothetical protein n=1 Tax=Nonomuraea sp. NPDC046802 TaxID=3154919 RepID=UPI00340DB2AA
MVGGALGARYPWGLSAQALTEAIADLASRHEIVGLGITEYAPSDPADEEMLKKLAPELVRLCGGIKGVKSASRP